MNGPQGQKPTPKHAKRLTADHLRLAREARERAATEARWAAAGCKPLDPEPIVPTTLPPEDVTTEALACIWCDLDQPTEVRWRGPVGTWICARCGAVHRIEPEEHQA